MEEQVLDTIDLNIGENYLYDWPAYYAIREIIANGLDETHQGTVEILEVGRDEYIIRDYGSGLKVENFIMSGTDKTTRNDVIGKFGVGLKDALAVLDNYGIKVEIMTQSYIFRTQKKEKCKLTDIKTLHVYAYENNKINFLGTQFTLKNCKKCYIDQAKEEFLLYKSVKEKILESTQYGDILGKEDKYAYIYINGMRIGSDEGLTFSYNIKNISSNLKSSINRERKNISRDSYRDDIKRIISECNESYILDIFEKQLKMTYPAINHSEIKWKDVLIKVINYITNKYSNKQVRFISSYDKDNNNELYEIISKSSDTEIIMISDKIRKDMEKNKKDIEAEFLFINDPIRIEEVLLNKEDLSYTQRKVLQEAVDILKMIDSVNQYSNLLDNIKISTLQIGSIKHELDGIIIPISCLISVENCGLKIINVLSCFGSNSTEFKDMLVCNLIKAIHEGKFSAKYDQFK